MEAGLNNQFLHAISILVSSQDGRYADLLSISRFTSQLYSQTNEDGIIAEIFRRVGVGKATFLEIGIGDGIQNTTHFLLEQGWQGIWFDSNEADVNTAKAVFNEYIEAKNKKITSENINEILDSVDAPSEFDLMSIDIDYNTTHVWCETNRKARVCCIEYNSSLPLSVETEVEYDPEASWDGTNYFGGSLKSIEIIGRSKGMSLVGCDLCGINAYLVSSAEAYWALQGAFHCRKPL